MLKNQKFNLTFFNIGGLFHFFARFLVEVHGLEGIWFWEYGVPGFENTGT